MKGASVSRSLLTMKKNIAARTATETKTSKTLFGVASEKLEIVCGGTGVIIKGVTTPSQNGG